MLLLKQCATGTVSVQSMHCMRLKEGMMIIDQWMERRVSETGELYGYDVRRGSTGIRKRQGEMFHMMRFF